MGYVEMSYGVGLMIGPLIGSIFMQLFNSILIVFFAFGGLLAIGLILVISNFPESLNKTGANSESVGENIADGKEVTFILFLRHRKSLMCLMAVVMVMITLSIFDPTLSIWLKRTYDITEKDNGIFFILVPLFFAINSS